MTWRTLDEWNRKGKIVIKGTKCILRDPDGRCLFNNSQVKKKNTTELYNSTHDSDSHPKRNSSYHGIYHKDDYDYDNWDFQ